MRLCDRLAQLFENQGATVRTKLYASDDGPTNGALTPQTSDDTSAASSTPSTMALNVEVRTRLVHVDVIDYIIWDQTVDYTFAQDITIRDETGFLLLRETLEGRFIQKLGFNSDAVDAFSAHYYGQMSQLAFNAKMRRQMLNENRIKPARN